MTGTVLDAAIGYVEDGFAVVKVYGVTDDGRCMCGNVECKAPGKHPIGDGWQRRACRDVDSVRDTFSRHTGNIGIYLGGSGLVVLDFDGAPGLRMREALEAEGQLVTTRRARSGSGGEHWLYRFTSWQAPDEVSDRKVAVGLDVKHKGQFLVAPSRHVSGGVYVWLNDAPVADLPDVLYDRIRQRTAPVSGAGAGARSAGGSGERETLLRRARAYVERMPSAVAGSGGHAATFSVARKLLQDFGLGEGDAWDLLLEYNARCEPPWSERELRHKLGDAARARVANPVEDRPAPARARGGGRGGGAALAVVPPPDSSPPAPPPASSSGPDWRSQLLWTESKGRSKLVVHTENVVLILQLHPEWKGLIRYDEFRGHVVVVGPPPWSEYHRPSCAETRWTDEDGTRLEAWLRREFHAYGFDPKVTTVERAVDVVARANSFNPVREYLESLAWDQTFRLGRAPAAYLGTPESEYASNVFTWWMISAVARVFEPGCKADHVLILEGAQGLGKSTALEILAGAAWFTDSPIDLNSKDAFERVRGRWIVELAELDSLFKAEASRAKQFFSSKRDDYRPAYGRREREQLRQCVFAGTVNLDVYLNDPTGARRFWPIVCQQIAFEALRRDRDQLWAEAVWRYHEGSLWYPTGSEVGVLTEEQADRTVRDDWTDLVGRFVARCPDGVTTADVLAQALQIDPKDWTRPAQLRVASVLRQHGLTRRRRRLADGSLSWVYLRNPDRL